MSLLQKLGALLHVEAFVDRIRSMTFREMILVTTAVVMVLTGYAGQLIVMNLWIANMGTINPAATPLTILTVSSLTTCICFLFAFAVRAVASWQTISFQFFMCKKAFILSAALGFVNAFQGTLTVYAAPGTPEIMQALFLCTQVFWTLAASKLFLNDERRLLNVLVVSSFLCVAGGIVLGASPTFSQSDPTTKSTKWWSIIFCISMIPAALYNVLASMFMRSFTEDVPESPTAIEDGSPLLVNKDSGRKQQGGEDNTEEETDDDGHARGDDTTVKITMLTATSVTQIVFMFALMPLNAVPWFGTSPDLAGTRQTVDDGWSCVFRGTHECSHAYVYCILFNFAYLLSYFGSSYLNHFSAALNAMVTQLSTPIAAIVLLIAPSLNVQGEAVSVGPSIGAIVLMIVGAALFTLWEHGTRKVLAA